MKKIRNVVVATQKKNKKLFSAVKNKFLDAKERIKNIDKKKLKRVAGVVGLATFLTIAGPDACTTNKQPVNKKQNLNLMKNRLKEEASVALLDAVMREDIDAIKQAIEEGADVNYVVKGPVYHGESLLYIAAKRGNIKAVKLLVENGADVNAKDNDGKTLLHDLMYFVPYKQSLEMLRLLIKNGADVNAKDNRGKTPLHYAIYRGSMISIKILVENGADVNAKDNDGNTPLHYVFMFPSIPNLSNYLVKHGADLNAKNKDGLKPYEVRGLLDCFKYDAFKFDVRLKPLDL